MVTPTVSAPKEYDPWADINDDGKIDILDIAYVAQRFGSTGTPIDKTAILLDLQARVAALETSVNMLLGCCNYSMIRLAALEATSPVVSQASSATSWVIVFGPDWVDLADAYLTISVPKTSRLVILFSAEVLVSEGSLVIRARIDDTFNAYPGDVTVTGYADTSELRAMTFSFWTYVPAGTYHVGIEVSARDSGGWYPEVWDRTLTVIAIPIP